MSKVGGRPEVRAQLDASAQKALESHLISPSQYLDLIKPNLNALEMAVDLEVADDLIRRAGNNPQAKALSELIHSALGADMPEGQLMKDGKIDNTAVDDSIAVRREVSLALGANIAVNKRRLAAMEAYDALVTKTKQELAEGKFGP